MATTTLPLAGDPLAADLATLPTPALVIDGAVARRNIDRLAAYCRGHGIALRPHTKTHKSRFVAGLQLAAGAIGLTVAKVGEAEVMATAGAPTDILMAYPAVDPARTARLARLAGDGAVSVGLDTAAAAAALSTAARAAGTTIGVLVDLDVGFGRTGVASPAAAVDLAAVVDRLPGLRLDGIMCYPGHVKMPPDDQAPVLNGIAERLADAIDRFDRAGLSRRIVSGGSTPTAFMSHLIPQCTEIRPGTSVYNDMNIVRGGFGTLADCAARVVCTVVSDAVAGQVVLDAGSKTLTSDPCGPAPQSGHGHVVEYPDAVITRLTEEHGQVDVSRCAHRPRVGERVTVIPNHVCPCVNLQDVVWWHEDDALVPLPVDARGRLS
ncbi:MAG: hypothetical protein FJ309_12410 [Planctomycetes bacterium]|nr:hypothetical protein [Planctomycetota bacterium]